MFSESILSTIVEVMAILVSADGVDERERQVVRAYLTTVLSLEKAEHYIDEFEEQIDQNIDTSNYGYVQLKMSSHLVKLCHKLNDGLTANQKVRLLVVMFTLVNADGSITELERDLVYAAAEVFNISFHELGLIERFVFLERPEQASNRSFLLIAGQALDTPEKGLQPLYWPGLNGLIVVIWLERSQLWAIKYMGPEVYLLDGAPLLDNQPVELAKGSSIRGGTMDTLYFAEIIKHIQPQDAERKVTFIADKISYRYPSGQYGLHSLDISEESGRLVGIMGPSGSGKSTLLEVLVGLRSPDTGQVRLNGYDIHKRAKSIEGLIGYVPQEDMLIEDLTVRQNLYYAARLSFPKYNDREIGTLVDKTLADLELGPLADKPVGAVHERFISGGERKRVNMALELLRKPAVMFLDEPTSGLSSRDSLSLIDLLKEQTFQGKLIFVVIHQPSSDIFKLFDHLIILDKGGYPIYYGDPVSAVVYFKQCIHQVNAEVSVCPTCANINPEQVFDIIEGRTLNHVGHFTTERRIAPATWFNYYNERLRKPQNVFEIRRKVRMPQRKPNWWQQWLIFTMRDLRAKLSNTQYVLLNLLTAPLLAFVLAFINKSSDGEAGLDVVPGQAIPYAFAANDNIPAYFFVSVVVAIFLGMTLSATEILNDRKLLRRERFLHLSRLAYLTSKVGIMFMILAVQMAAYTLIGNRLLGIHGVQFEFWGIMFALAACSTLTSLILSASFKSAITVYILIPILIIPQLLLGGVVIPYLKINPVFAAGSRVPVVAEFIPARWGFEALMVEHFQDNPFMTPRYALQREVAVAEVKHSTLMPQLQDMALQVLAFEGRADTSVLQQLRTRTLLYHLKAETWGQPSIAFPYYHELGQGISKQNRVYWQKVPAYLDGLKGRFKQQAQDAQRRYAALQDYMTRTEADRAREREIARGGHNLAVEKWLRNTAASPQLIWTGQRFEPTVYPIFLWPEPWHKLDFRAHFFAPVKHIMGFLIPTPVFNVIVLTLMSLVLFLMLYFNIMARVLRGFRSRPMIE